MPTTCEEDLLALATGGTLMNCSQDHGRIHYLYRAVDQDGDFLDILVQVREKKAGKKFFRKLLKGLHYVPRATVISKLRSYSAAKAELLSSVEHCQQKYQNKPPRIRIGQPDCERG